MEILKKRDEKANKGTYGKVIIIGGSLPYIGSVLLASLGASKSGVGYVALGIEKKLYPYVAGKIYETIYEILSSFSDIKTLKKIVNKYNSIVFGNGIENNKKTKKALEFILNNYDKKLLIDATGLSILKSLNINILLKTKAKVILTPHLKEFSSLFDIDITNKNALDLTNEAKKIARKYHITLVLKDFNSYITNGDKFYVVTSGNAGLAHAGSGDVLAGFIGGLLAFCDSDNVDIAFFGHHIFSLSAKYLAKDISLHSMSPVEVCNQIGYVLKKEKL